MIAPILFAVVRTLSAIVIRLWFKIYHGFHIVGSRNLPTDGSFVLVANHASHLDVLCLMSALPLRRVNRAYAAAATDYFFAGPLRKLAAVVFANAVPLDRWAEGINSLEPLKNLLDQPGNILMMFPEGTRTITGVIGPFKAGVGLLLAGRQTMAVPCRIEGSSRGLPKGAWFPRPCGIRLTIGKPRSYAQVETTRRAAEQISGELRHAIIELGEVKPLLVNPVEISATLTVGLPVKE